MKRITENGKRYAVFMKQFQQLPKIRMQDRIASGNIEIRETVVSPAKIKTVIERVLDLLPVHGICFFAGISRENVAVPAPLVAFIRNVPLKRKILLHFAYLTLHFYKKSAPAIKAVTERISYAGAVGK